MSGKQSPSATIGVRYSAGIMSVRDILWNWSNDVISQDARLDPQSAVPGGLSERENCEYKPDILTGKGAEIEIHRNISSIILFAECPELTNNSIGKLVIDPYENATCSGIVLSSDNCLEMVALLNLERWIDTSDIPVEDILRDGDKTRLYSQRSIFETR